MDFVPMQMDKAPRDNQLQNSGIYPTVIFLIYRSGYNALVHYIHSDITLLEPGINDEKKLEE
jgi:hypothetical protein